ncbi:MAG: hypothetical protein CVU56_03480 [Deltaproteobacteria bacterium HGW-Deltaproteobacteria-14]|nr:MAG: hypothetical protein CVU56_03480 [Deltaproteobacteria bacterium HGW-Deltaproteobacteria-14]
MKPLLPLVLMGVALAGCANGPGPDAAPAPGDTATASPAAPDASPADATPTPDTATPGGQQGGLVPECDPGAIAEGAFVTAGQQDAGTAVLPNGRRVRPAGVIVPLADRAMGLALHPDGLHAYVIHGSSKANPDGVWVVDLPSGAVVQKLTGYSGYHGIALSPAGDRLAVAGLSSGRLHRFTVGADGLLTALDSVNVGVSLIDCAFDPDGATVYALSNTNSKVYGVDFETGAIAPRARAGTNAYDLVLDAAAGRAYASNLASGTVSAMDLATGELLANVPVGKNPEGLALDATRHRLYVANSDSDTVSVIDTEALAVIATWDLTGNDGGHTGGALDALWLDPSGDTLYAAQARRNAVSLVATADGSVRGAIPTGHYPVDLALSPDERTLVTVSMKGFGSGKSDLQKTLGQLNIAPVPDADGLAALTAEVADNNLGPSGWYPAACTGDALPPALRGGPDRPIKHVVLIIKENKTYDVVLGDDPTLGDGDPELCLFPEAVTPNIHALARSYTNMDNYYADAEVSIQGHLWTTMADCNDYAEKIHEAAFAIYGYEPATIVAGGTIFDHCLVNGVTFRNYGEFPGFGHHLMDDFEAFVDHKYPFWTMSVPDVEKAAEFIREFDQGIFSDFTYIVLPNDHTYGGKAGAPDPTWMVADNDAGLGMIVEAISHSEYWPETAIFVIEDDPQGPPDHVHSHRSISVVVSPHVRRGYVSSVHYSIPSLYATIERILGLPALNRNTLEAPPMIDIWLGEGDTPDYLPYQGLPNAVDFAVNPAGTEAARVSAGLDFSIPDRAEGLGAILWEMIKGDRPMPPYARFSDE